MANCADSTGTTAASATWRLVALVLPPVVLVHFGLVMLVMAAPATIPPAAQPAVEAYLVPVFAQDWRLFAPSPDVHDYAVFARGSTRVGERVEWTPWLNLIDPLVAAVQSNRLAPEGVHLNLVYKAAARTLDRAGPLSALAMGRESVADRWASIEQQPASLIILERLASADLAETYPNRPFESVQVMVTARLVGPSHGTNDRGGQALLFHPVPFDRVAAR